MIQLFIKENLNSIRTGFKWISFIFTTLVIIIFIINFIINGQTPDLLLFIIVILSAGIGFPIFAITVIFLRWWWDYSVIKRNFSSYPFSQLDSIGFNKIIKNKGSKTELVNEYYSGKINEFIVDCTVDTQSENKLLSFNFYVNIRPMEKSEFLRIQREFKSHNGVIDFNCVSKKYHYKNHHLKSVKELENELIDFGKMILNENIEPKAYAIV